MGVTVKVSAMWKKLIAIWFIIIVVDLGSIFHWHLHFQSTRILQAGDQSKQLYNWKWSSSNALSLYHYISLSFDLSKWRNTQWSHLYVCLCRWLQWGHLWKWVHHVTHRLLFTTSHGIWAGSQTYFNENKSDFTPSTKQYTPMHHIDYCIFLQTVVGCVRMKGPWM